jgi:hypothetical protein
MGSQEIPASNKEQVRTIWLELEPTKTWLIEFGRFAERDCKVRNQGKPETFDFLGFTHYCSKSKDGRFRVKRKTVRKELNMKLKS